MNASNITFSLRLPEHKLPEGPFWLKQKQKFHLETYTTVLGSKIPNLEIGYETYGKLNSDKSNAILICHYFSGSSNAAGKYTPEDIEPGYWDTIIGPNKAIDTNKFFVISSDILCNINAYDPNIITTGPMSMNPETQKIYGPDFPMTTPEDLVHVQKKLVESFGIKKLYCVAGPSLGAMQSLQWAATFPDFVDRIIPVIGAGLETPPLVVAALDFWAEPIYLDPKWNLGYYEKQQGPDVGFKLALRVLTHQALSPAWAESVGGRGFRLKDPSQNMNAHFYVQDALMYIARLRFRFLDPLHYLRVIKMAQIFSIRNKVKNLKAKILMISCSSDLLMLPEYSKQSFEELKTLNKDVQYFEIAGRGGHMDGIFSIEKASDVIRDFLI